MLFAAGLGTRMGSLTKDRPKPLLSFSGRPLIDHAFDLVDKADIETTAVNLHHHGEQVRRHLSGRPDVVFSDESGLLRETGGGLKAALPLLPGDAVYTLNSDAAWSDHSALSALARAWWPDRMEALLLLCPIDRCLNRDAPGDFTMNPDGRLKRVGPMVYTGAQIIARGPVEAEQDEVFSLNAVWEKMIARSTIYGVIYGGYWADVGTPAGLEIAETMLEAGE
jgi:MurNAc alpha-1-phosphate uridylyltransferase